MMSAGDFRHSFALMNLLNIVLSRKKNYINGTKKYLVCFCCTISSTHNFQYNELSNLRFFFFKKRYGSSKASSLAPPGGNETNAI